VTMEERRIKSYGFYATLEFLENNYDEEKRKQVLAGVSPGVRTVIDNPKKAQWASPEWSGELWSGIVKLHSPEEAMQQLVKAGRHQGAYATNTYLKLLMKMLTMKMFAKKFNDIWSRDANFGRAVVGDLDEIANGRLDVGFKDLGKFPYFGPITQGWFSFAFETMGLKNVKVELRNWSMQNPDPGEVSYHVNWTR
jgi:hypothetical protein